jgi:molybdopterin-containing oxidoreductase family membrane subunit
MARVLGVFDMPGKTAAAIDQIRGRGYTDIVTYAPAPFTEVEDAVDPKPSRVRLFTLIGGLVGFITGYAMTIWMANNWQLVIGGKPFSSIPPYTIIAFELTILFGGLMTALGLFIHGRLLRYGKDELYDPRFSAEDFGVVVTCQSRDVTELESLLRQHGAMEVNLVEA